VILGVAALTAAVSHGGQLSHNDTLVAILGVVAMVVGWLTIK